jgi:hypothetical protein
MTIDQIMILLCSAGSIYFLSGNYPIIGFALGLLGQPFWLYSAYHKNQPAIILLALWWFTFCHARGLVRQYRNLKTKKEMADRLQSSIEIARSINKSTDKLLTRE